jgi:hypothetical protein
LSWQTLVYKKLRNRDWFTVGVLFEEVEAEIPLHKATRWYLAQPRNKDKPIPSSSEARWRYFRYDLSRIGVEREPYNKYRIDWNDKVRLSYVNGKSCPDCGGPVIRSTWSTARHTICLACEKPLEITYTMFRSVVILESVTFRPEPIPEPTPEPEPIPEPKADKPKPPPQPPVVDLTDKGFTSLSEIRKLFFDALGERLPTFQSDPKLRRSLHRALEAGIMDEFRNMTMFRASELASLKYRRLSNGALFIDSTIFNIRAKHWMERTFTAHRRKYWTEVLGEAYGFGALAIFLLFINDRIEPLHGEIVKLIGQHEPKMKTPGEVRQRWGTPVKAAARNAINRLLHR